VESFSIRDVAVFLGVSPLTVRRRIKRGDIRAFKAVSGRYRVPRVEVERLVPGVLGGEEGEETEEVEAPVDLEVYREAALRHLKRGIDLSGGRLRSSELDDAAKTRWAHCLAQLVAAYVNLSKTLGTGEEERTLAKLFALLDKVPKKYRQVVLAGVEGKFGKRLRARGRP